MVSEQDKETWNEMQADAVPLSVTCARCGKAGTSDDFYLEEGDEWECPDCWYICESEESSTARTTAE